MDDGQVLNVLPGVSKETDDEVTAWLNTPLGGTVRRAVASALGILLVMFGKYLPFHIDDSQLGLIVTVVVAYVFQSAHHSAKTVEAKATIAAATVTSQQQAITALNAPVPKL
jgi:hypothetical protein